MTNNEESNAVPAKTAYQSKTTAAVTDPAVIARLLKRDKFLVRWFNYSHLARLVSKQNKLPPVPTFLLTTKGRRTGNWIELPIYYFRDGENYVVVGSNGGAEKPPLWFLNLQADPDCKIHINWRTQRMRARIAAGEERARIWAKACKQFPNYIDYAVTAGKREIPVVVLEKR
jgi:deazaflavin-dependent oxidoreductase (nitroreductase family)